MPPKAKAKAAIAAPAPTAAQLRRLADQIDIGLRDGYPRLPVLQKWEAAQAAEAAGTTPLPTGSEEDLADVAEVDQHFAQVGTRTLELVHRLLCWSWKASQNPDLYAAQAESLLWSYYHKAVS